MKLTLNDPIYIQARRKEQDTKQVKGFNKMYLNGQRVNHMLTYNHSFDRLCWGRGNNHRFNEWLQSAKSHGYKKAKEAVTHYAKMLFDT